MNILRPSFEILTPISEGGIEELKHLEKIGRVCYKSEDKITEDGSSAKKFISNIVKSGHEAIIEHGSVSVLFTVDRGITHEIVRHRVASYAQESTRYVNYSQDRFGNGINVIDVTSCVDYDSSLSKLSADELQQVYYEWYDAMADAERHYMKMLELGVSPQIARGVLPNSTKAELTMTANYREWRHFFQLRCAKGAHPQIREVAIPLCKEFQKRLPILFDDIQVE